MPTTTRKGRIAKTDIAWHVPGTDGTAETNFNRTNSSGGSSAKTKVSAQCVPLLDAPIVSGARTPFESLVDSAAAKTVELALADIRKNIPHYKNFDHYGGSTTNDAATAVRNTQVFQKIVTDILAENRTGSGIFFPGFRYYFKESAGAMPTMNGVAKPTLVGAGFGSVLLRETSASTALNLFNFIDCNGLRLADLGIDRDGTAGLGNAVNITNNAEQEVGDIYFLNTSIVGGLSNVSVVLAGPSLATNVWLSGNFFNNSSGANVSLQSCQRVHVLSNNFGLTGNGLSVTSNGGSTVLGDIEIDGNVHLGANSDINVTRTGVWNAIHKGLTISNNKLTAGDIIVQGVDDVGLFTNNLYSGRISITFDMLTSKNLRLIDNNVNGAVGSGITVTGATCTLTGYQIRGGTISNATQRGILLTFSGAPIRGGTISGVSIIDCSRQDGGVGTDFSGICLDAPGGGAAGVLDSIIEGNIIRCYSVTAPSGNKHAYGVEEVAGGASDRNMIGPNFIKGYVTADVLLSGANSVDVVARYTALDTAAAQRLGSFDGGIPI